MEFFKMKVFINKLKASRSLINKKSFFIDSLCPYNKTELCGNWCALFRMHISDSNNSSYYVLGCDEENKRIYFKEIK